MKKFLKIIGIIFLVLMGISAFTRAIIKPTYENSFEAQIKRANQDCPIPVANGMGQVSSIYLDNKMLVYRLDYKPGFVNIDAYKNNPEAARDMFYLAFVCLNAQGSQGNQLVEKLKSEGYGLRIIASNGTSSFTTDLTTQYIENMRRKVELNPSEALHEALVLKLETESGAYPIQADEGMMITGMKLEDNNIVVLTKVDENLYDISAFASVADEFGQNLIDEANAGDPELGALMDLCKISHSGIIYRIIGIHSKKHCDLPVPSDEIRRQRNIPPQVNIR